MATEFMRFTLEQANTGEAAGWRLSSGWFHYQLGRWWAWFERTADG